MKIACVGDNCIDFYDAPGEKYPGGNPVNVAVYVRRLGGEASYVGAVGTDENGRFLLDAVKKRGVDVSRVQQLPGATALSHVSHQNGDRVFGAYEEGVMADFSLREEDIEFICAHDLAVTGLWGHVEGRLAEIRARGVPVAFDGAEKILGPIGLAALPHVDIAFFSDDRLSDEALREKMLRIAGLGPRLVVATRGGKGSLACDGKDFYSYGIVPGRIVDTMGAGDSYIAGFLIAWLQKRDIPACMRAGAENAAQTIGYAGAW